MPRRCRTILTLSGGLDSTVLLADLIHQGHDVSALAVDYGQRHRVELEHARRIAGHFGVPFEIADLRGITHLLAGSSQTDPRVDVPSGHYTDQTMKQTIVPNRNMILLAVAAAWAMSRGADAVAYAAHAGDHTIYPDCRPPFADAMAQAIGLADWRRVELLRPFVHLTKAQIVQRGAELAAPLAMTWSCYRGGAMHCGACGTCVERREAFALARVADPTTYAELIASTSD